MNDTAEKHCHTCKNDLPATEQYFFPSYLKPGGRNECKECHKKRGGNDHNFALLRKRRLVEAAQLIEDEAISSYRTLSIVAKTLGRSTTQVESDMAKENFPLFKFLYHNGGMSLALRPEDAEAYIVSASNGHNRADTQQIDIGTPDRCGSCGTEKGNILGDIDKKTHEKHGYLCAKCHQLVRDFHGDRIRMHKVLAYIERTRLSHV